MPSIPIIIMILPIMIFLSRGTHTNYLYAIAALEGQPQSTIDFGS